MKSGFNTYTKLVTVCENETVSNELPYILEEAVDANRRSDGVYDWTHIEKIHVDRWLKAREEHKKDIKTTTTFKLESLANTHRNRIRTLEQQISDAMDDNIRRMRQSELETVQEKYEQKVRRIKETADRAEIYTTLLVNGVISIMKEGS